MASVPLIFVFDRYYAAPRTLSIPLSVAAEARARVSEADRQGIACAAASGYDPEPLLDNLEKLPHVTPITHPPAAERIRQAREAIAGLEARSGYIVSTHEFEAVKRRVEQLYAPARQRAGNRPTLYR